MNNIELYLLILSGVLFIGSEIIAHLPIEENSWIQILGTVMKAVYNAIIRNSIER